MSYTLKIADKAMLALGALEPWLQEEALDEIDRLADRRERLMPRGPSPGLVRDFTRERGGIVHYIFMVFDRDDAHEQLVVNVLAHVAKHEETGEVIVPRDPPP